MINDSTQNPNLIPVVNPTQAEQMNKLVVLTHNKNGSTHGRTFTNKSDLEKYLNKIRQRGKILCGEKLIGKIEQGDQGKWNWYYDQEIAFKIPPEISCKKTIAQNFAEELAVQGMMPLAIHHAAAKGR
jgi:hypothetical protein